MNLRLPRFPHVTPVLLGIFLVLLAMILLAGQLLAPLDRLLYDGMLRLGSRTPPGDVVLVTVDEPSLERLGRWPWSREIHARLVERLTEVDVRAIAFHILFSEVDTVHPEGDARFARALAESGRVALAVAPVSSSAAGQLKMAQPLAEFAAAARLGHVDVELDPDGVSRSVFLRAGLGQPQWPFLALAALQIAQPGEPRSLPGDRPKATGHPPASDNWARDYRILVPFAGPPGSYRQLSYADVLHDPRIAAGLRGSTVFVGVTAAGLDTPLSTPLGGWSGTMSAVEYSANVYTALREGGTLTPMPRPAALALTAVLALLPMLFYATLSSRRLLLITATLLGACLFLSFLVLHGLHLWFPPASAMTALLLSYPLWTRQQLQVTVRDLFAEKARSSATLHSIADAVITTDAGGAITYMNPVAESISGYRLEEARGQSACGLLHMEDETGQRQELTARDTVDADWGSKFTRHGFLLDRDGNRHAVRTVGSRLGGPDGKPAGLVLAISDVTETLALNESMRHQATHDSLTGLPNRTLLEDRLLQAIAHAHRDGRQLAVLFLDIDRFKHVVDSLGHGVADQLLQAIAERIRASSRESDTVARWSGDRFVIVSESLPTQEAAGIIADKLIQTLAAPISLTGQNTYISACIGISLFPEDGRDPAGLLKHADMAMHHAKASGPGRFRFYSSDMDAWAQQRHDLEQGLRHALTGKEFLLHYQPQIELATYRITGVEALLRWRRQGELLSPGQFISIAEESGLIHDIGQWALEEACRQAMAWQAEGLPPITLSVNLSPRQFSQHDLLGQVTRAVDQAGVDPGRIKLEITEHAFVREQDQAIEVLRQLQAMGLKVSLDDFGTGYSSLSYVKHFPVQELKLDQSFVKNVSHDRNDAAIARAVVALAHGMQLGVVAEGVEHQDQLEFLQGLGCDVIQGYLVSRPLPAADLAALLKSSEGRLLPASIRAPADSA